MGQRYGQKPSSWLVPEETGETPDERDRRLVFAFNLDLAAMLCGHAKQEEIRLEADLNARLRSRTRR